MQNLKTIYYGLLIVVVALFNMPFFCDAAITDKDIEISYTNADYTATVSLLEEEIRDAGEKAVRGEKVNFPELYSKHLFLAHLYAWKLNKTDEALNGYQKASELRQSSAVGKRLLPVEFLFVAEIYEGKNDYSKAMEYYQKLLDDVVFRKEDEHDDVSIIMYEELTKFIQYQIDSIGLKKKTRENFTPSLARFKLTPAFIQVPVYQLMLLVFLPSAKLDFAIAEREGLASFIKHSPTNISSMILNYMLIVNASASSVTESSEKAMQIYLSKYPAGYYSLLLRQMFYRFYKETGQDGKARQLLAEMKGITEERKMELITEPDKRFSSPEKTWETYKKAMIEGDLDGVLECYVPGGYRHKEVYNVFGIERTREMGREIGDIERVSGGEKESVYMIRRIENGKEVAYEIRFFNMDGEWKMQEF